MYQPTLGEVVLGDNWKSDAPTCGNLAGTAKVLKRILGQCKGLPLFSTNVHICHPKPDDDFDQSLKSPI